MLEASLILQPLGKAHPASWFGPDVAANKY